MDQCLHIRTPFGAINIAHEHFYRHYMALKIGQVEVELFGDVRSNGGRQFKSLTFQVNIQCRSPVPYKVLILMDAGAQSSRTIR